MKRAAFGAACLVAVMAMPAWADQASTTGAPVQRATASGPGSPSGESSDQRIANAHQTDFQLGQLAVIRGRSAQVRRFGQTMMDDHGSVVSRLAQQNAVEFPLEIDATHRRLEEDLSSMSGREFDRKFIDAMVEDHEAMAAMLREQAGTSARAGAVAPTSGDVDHTTAAASNDSPAPTGTSGRTPKSTGERMGAVGTSGTSGTGASAASELRTVERHLAQARRIQRALGGSGSR